jgi:hypothetical protein
MLLVLLLPWQAFVKQPKSQYWTACFRDQNGRQRRISTKETNNKKALKIAEEFERAAKTKRTLSKSKMFWTGYTKRSPANASFEQH